MTHQNNTPFGGWCNEKAISDISERFAYTDIYRL
jgi:hypothetical protein